MANLIRLDLIITGNVQGVGFRYFVKNKAELLGIHGFVRNNRDGSVFVSAEGKNDVIEKFLGFCYRGPQTSLVKNIEKTKKPTENLKGFLIHY